MNSSDPSPIACVQGGRAWQRVVRGLLALLVLALAGCATRPVTEITLAGVVRGQRALAGTVPAEAVRLVRDGRVAAAAPEMVLRAGDAVETGPDTAAVIAWPGGARAYLYPGTRVVVGSLFEDIGKVFVRVKGLFEVRTTFLTAGSEGTEYWVVVQPGRVWITVAEGSVRLAATGGAWAPRSLRAGQQATAQGPGAPSAAPANRADMQRDLDYIRALDSLVPVRTALSPWVIPAAIIGVGAAVIFGGSDGDRPPRPADAGTTTPGSDATRPSPAPTTSSQPPPRPTPPPAEPPVRLR